MTTSEEDARDEAKQQLSMQAAVLEGYKSFLADKEALLKKQRETEKAALDEQPLCSRSYPSPAKRCGT